ncbi:MAG: alpha/beta fold hydrolase, partial [Candidatus Bathyarchaeota archaeon]
GFVELWPTAPFAGRINLALDDEGKSDVDIKAPDIIRKVLEHADVYSSFVEAVYGWGYEENTDFFVFPYDWRLNNYDHVEALDDLIDKALASTGQKKAVLVAHSMGGLVARAYMDQKHTEKVDSFITMGTPHLGAVKPYYAFLSGYNFDNDLAGNSLMKVVIQNCPAAYQIMPWKPFISGPSQVVPGSKVEWSLEEAYGVKYHSTYLEPRTELFYLDANDWEWFLNPVMVDEARVFRNSLGTSAPIGIHTYTIIGQGIATLSSYTAREPTTWESLGYTGIKKADGSRWVLEPDLMKDFGDGDSTVPIWSSSGLQNDKKFYIQDLPGISAAHGALPANSIVQALIKDIITGEEVDVSGYPKVEFNDLVGKAGFEIHSSANLHIYDSEGNHLGVNENGSIDESIPGATMIAMDGYEYCSILNPDDSYDIEVVGFENGNFTLNVVIRSDGRTVEFSYPEIDVVNGSVASFSIPDTQSALVDPPEITVQNMETILTFTPEVVEAQEPVEDKATETDANGGIPGFPVWSIGIALIICSLILRKQVFS